MRPLVDPQISSFLGGNGRRANWHLLLTAFFAFGFFYLLLRRDGGSFNAHARKWERLQEIAIVEPDGFANFTKAPDCDVDTQHLHHAFEPKCPDRQSLLTAMSSGGRYGWDRPYAPLDCDMYWMYPDDICETLAKFNNIHIIGDSLARQLMLALHMILREDLVNGARVTWMAENENADGAECYCRGMFSEGTHKSCFWYEAIDTAAILENDPDSIRCGGNIGNFSNAFLAKYPLEEEHMGFYFEDMQKKGFDKIGKQVYILSQGGWNHYNTTETLAWIDQLEDHFREYSPIYFNSPRLFVTPLAQGENKPDKYLRDFNNIMVMRHSHRLEPKLKRRGFEYLSSFNMSMQALTPDSIHGSLETTLLQAMMVYNWLKYL